MKIDATIAVALLIGISPQSGLAGSYHGIAKKISALAGGGRVLKVAVLPFASGAGGPSRAGLYVAERITEQLVKRKTPGLVVVERTLIGFVLQEQGFAQRGGVDPREAVQIGKLLGVDAIVAGSYLPLPGKRMEVHARVIKVESGEILAASRLGVREDWEEGRPIIENAGMWSFLGIQTHPSGVPAECGTWKGQVDVIQAGLLDLNARYWALKFQEGGISPRNLVQHPGWEIRSPELRERFFELLRKHYNGGDAAEFTASEMARLRTADNEAAWLVKNCAEAMNED